MQQKSLLIVGGSGNLGRAIVSKFIQNWKVVNIDFNKNEQSSLNISKTFNFLVLNKNDVYYDELPDVYKQINSFSEKYDSIMCVAGGWVGGSVKDTDVFKKLDLMQKMNVNSTLLSIFLQIQASHLATKYLNSQGLLIFTGAAMPFRKPYNIFQYRVPSMISYVLSKTATHAISMNAALREEIPKDSTVITILPYFYNFFREVIDTPENRVAMPDQDFSKWTSPQQIADLLKMWADGTNRPNNGSFSILKNQNGMVVPEFV